MGNAVSSYPETPVNFPVFTLTIRSYDKIKIIDGNEAVVNIVRQSIVDHYGTIQQETIGNEGGMCFQLSGWPFSHSRLEQAIKTKHFFIELLSDLYRNGWKLWISSDLSRMYDYSTLFFHQCPAPPKNFTICCLSLSGSDKFQLIGAPDSLWDSLLKCIGSRLQEKNIYANCLAVKMYGNFWKNSSYHESNTARYLLLSILRAFRRKGYAYFGTVNFKGTADTIFFIDEGTPLPEEQYCIISLNAKDRLRLMECPKTLVDMTTDIIAERWPGGLQDTQQDDGHIEFKMKGYPWVAHRKADAVNSRLFIANLLEESVKRGWAVLTSLDISRKLSDKAVFVMRSCEPLEIPHFCIAPADCDKIRIIGATNEMVDVIVNVIMQCWSPGLQDTVKEGNNLELKLAGWPWECTSLSNSFALARLTMARILTALEQHGWSVVCSADMSAKHYSDPENQGLDHATDVHTWFVAQTSLGAPSASLATAPPAYSNTTLPPSYIEALDDIKQQTQRIFKTFVNSEIDYMGATISQYPETPSDFPVFSLTIRTYDQIKIIDGNSTVVNIVRQNLEECYGQIQYETIGDEGGTCFKLSGYPFSKNIDFKHSVKIKHFFTQLLAELYQNGWKLRLSSDLSRMYDYSTLFFHRCPPPAENFSICCLSISSTDKFQLIDAPNCLHDALLKSVDSLLEEKGVYGNCLEVKMHGNLWQNSSYSQSNRARSLLLRIFRTFREHGFAYFGTINLKGTADSIFFINENVPLPPEQYCIISLNMRDRLRLIECPKVLADLAAKIIADRWPGGIQDIQEDPDCVEYKLKGYPWYACRRKDAVISRQFIVTLLEETVRKGWTVLTSLDVSRKLNDKAVFVLKNCPPTTIPHFCIAPADRDKIRIIGARKEMENVVANIVKECWTPGIQNETKGSNSLELKLIEYPWVCYSLSESFALARLMMARILANLEEFGWSVICSADISAKYCSNSDNSGDNPSDVHSWFVARTSVFHDGFPPPSYKEAVENN
ncbi:hypothetical protein QR680_016131 [Steinernema hermaphroditum]|uniref:Uncharacterized protein n=1 Tax=Steinernema hermaphroditum TaxID=289476 RepID=A0AA39LLF9_9BILA|nr:hypothetical protein QR680_016131 [Steinernema hermaphroditum]